MIRESFKIPEKLTVAPQEWANHWQFREIPNFQIGPVYVEGWQRREFPDGIMRSPEEAQALFIEIARRYNAHDALVQACEEFRKEWVRTFGVDEHGGTTLYDAAQKALHALRLAEGRTP